MYFKDFVYVVFNKDYYPKRHKLLGHLNNMCFDIIKILLVSLNDDFFHFGGIHQVLPHFLLNQLLLDNLDKYIHLYILHNIILLIFLFLIWQE